MLISVEICYAFQSTICVYHHALESRHSNVTKAQYCTLVTTAFLTTGRQDVQVCAPCWWIAKFLFCRSPKCLTARQRSALYKCASRIPTTCTTGTASAYFADTASAPDNNKRRTILHLKFCHWLTWPAVLLWVFLERCILSRKHRPPSSSDRCLDLHTSGLPWCACDVCNETVLCIILLNLVIEKGLQALFSCRFWTQQRCGSLLAVLQIALVGVDTFWPRSRDIVQSPFQQFSELEKEHLQLVTYTSSALLYFFVYKVRQSNFFFFF